MNGEKSKEEMQMELNNYKLLDLVFKKADLKYAPIIIKNIVYGAASFLAITIAGILIKIFFDIILKKPQQ